MTIDAESPFSMLSDVLASRWSEFIGRTATLNEIELLQRELPSAAVPWFVELVGRCPLVGLTFSLSEREDLSGAGIEFEWMPVKAMVAEANEAYPGIAVRAHSYVPIGSCLYGSGNPYFLQLHADEPNPPVYRVIHDAAPIISAAHGNPLVTVGALDGAIETVSSSLAEFFRCAKITL